MIALISPIKVVVLARIAKLPRINPIQHEDIRIFLWLLPPRIALCTKWFPCACHGCDPIQMRHIRVMLASPMIHAGSISMLSRNPLLPRSSSNQAMMKPNQTAPESPKNILALGRFQYKKPKLAPMSKMASRFGGLSGSRKNGTAIMHRVINMAWLVI